MSRRTVTIGQPFTGGMRPDLPTFALGPTETPVAQDLIVRNLFAQQRYGWEYDGSTADVAQNLRSIYRAKFVLSGTTRTLTTYQATSPTATYGLIHNSAAAASEFEASDNWQSSSDWYPRAMYKDQLVYCCQDGESPAMFYSGSRQDNVTTTPATAQNVSGKATIDATSGTYDTDIGPGHYVVFYDGGTDYQLPLLWFRILERTSTTSITVEDIKASATATLDFIGIFSFGKSIPCVNIYDAGTVSTNGTGTTTGTGTAWSGGAWGAVDDGDLERHDGILYIPAAGSTAQLNIVGSVASATSITANDGLSYTNVKYAILRRCPFKDVAAHRGSLWGTGVKQHPNRVYISPLDWNPSIPPGFTPPLDPQIALTSTNPNDFLLDFIDVPTPFHGDPNVAILSAPDSLLVLKRDSYYRITGQHPNVDWVEGEQGKGCIDIRSAWNIDGTPFWAGENGIFAYWQGYAYDLTSQRINKEWRQLVQGGVSYCSLGVTHGYLIVHVTNAQATQRTYAYRLPPPGQRPDGGHWDSRITNLNPRYMHSARISGEVERLLVVHDDDQGRVIDASPVFSGKKTNSSTDFSAAATDADPRDDDGTSPSFEARTGTGLFGGNGIDGETVVYDAAISHNVYDTGAANASNIDVSWVYSGGLQESAGETTLTLADIQSDSTDLIDRTDFPDINASGRLHQLRLDQNTTATTHKKTEIAQVVVEVEHLDPGT